MPKINMTVEEKTDCAIGTSMHADCDPYYQIMLLECGVVTVLQKLCGSENLDKAINGFHKGLIDLCHEEKIFVDFREMK